MTVVPAGNTDTVVLVPILRRHHRVQPLLQSITTAGEAVRVLFITTPGDTRVHDTIDTFGCERIEVPWSPTGDYARKLNAGYRHTTEPLIFCGADDLEFLRGWLGACREVLKPGIGVVGTNDMGNPRVIAGDHSTHSLITRQYADTQGTIDGPGALVVECYPHEYVDDELVGTAKARGAWAFAEHALIRHLHPDWDASIPRDDMYNGQARRMAAGRRLYQSRRRRWT